MITDCHAHVSSGTAAVPGGAVVHLMSTNHKDIPLVAAYLAQEIIPYFGIHPWFCHWYYTGDAVSKRSHYAQVLNTHLEDFDRYPDPIPLSKVIQQVTAILRERVRMNLPFGIGEVGLDRSFTTDSCKVKIEHQQIVLEHFADLAQLFGCPMLVHGVSAHQHLLQSLQSYTCPIVLHLFGGSADTAKIWLKTHKEIYWSVSHAINMRSCRKLQSLLNAIPLERILLESDRDLDSMTAETHQHYLQKIQSFVVSCQLSKEGGEEAAIKQSLCENALRLNLQCNSQIDK